MIGLTLAISLAAATLTASASVAPALAVRWSVNEARLRDHLPLLRTSPELMAIAARRAAEITTDFSHDRAGVPDMWWGEMIGWTSGVRGSAAAAFIVRLWLASAEHRAILLGCWTYIGAGIAAAAGRLYSVVIVGHFGARPPCRRVTP